MLVAVVQIRPVGVLVIHRDMRVGMGVPAGHGRLMGVLVVSIVVAV